MQIQNLVTQAYSAADYWKFGDIRERTCRSREKQT